RHKLCESRRETNPGQDRIPDPSARCRRPSLLSYVPQSCRKASSSARSSPQPCLRGFRVFPGASRDSLGQEAVSLLVLLGKLPTVVELARYAALRYVRA